VIARTSAYVVPVAERQSTSMVGFVVLVAAVLLGCAYLGWRIYDSPVDPGDAGLVATQATQVVVRAGGGDARACEAMQDVAAADEAEGVVQRCIEIAENAAAGSRGWLGVRGLHVTNVDVGRSSGTVTVSGTLLTQGPAFPMSFTWPVSREDGRWTVSDGPDVEVG
jgi:hypothetical protein